MTSPFKCFVSRKNSGFTLIELLIAIVIIGILATLGAVGWNGITTQSRTKAAEGAAFTAAIKLGTYKSSNFLYPSNLAGINIINSGDTTYQYTVDNVSEPVYYCATVTVVTVSYYVSSTEKPRVGACPDHAAGSATIGWRGVEATGNGNRCGVKYSNDRAYCWGSNNYGQLGDGTTSSSSAPVAVSTSGALSGKTIKSINVGSGAGVCAIASDNNAYCWGRNNSGQLGNGTTNDTSVPVAVDTSGVLSGKTMKSIRIAGFHACGVASDNNAYCWGSGASLGNGTTTTSFVPVAVLTSGVLSGKTIKSIDVGYLHTCVIASDNQAYCWGGNSYGQLGNGTTGAYSSSPVAVTTSGVLNGKTLVAVSAGEYYTCVIASDNQAYCWGRNNRGQLGNGNTTDSTVPVAVTTSGVLNGKTLKSISTDNSAAGGDDNHTCAIASDNQAYCWGRNNSGQLGNGNTTDSSVPVAVTTSGALSGKTVLSISAGESYTCAIASDNQAYCWGTGLSSTPGLVSNP